MFKKKSPAVPLGCLHTKTDEGKKNKFGTWREAETVDFLPELYLYIQSSEVYSPTLDVLRVRLTPQGKVRRRWFSDKELAIFPTGFKCCTLMLSWKNIRIIFI